MAPSIFEQLLSNRFEKSITIIYFFKFNGKISHQEHKGTKIMKKNQYDDTMYA